jgi:hypothetical protein
MLYFSRRIWMGLARLSNKTKYINYINKTFISNSAFRVLGIECTCDDTSVAIVDTNRKILTECHRNQWMIHKNKGKAPS